MKKRILFLLLLITLLAVAGCVSGDDSSGELKNDAYVYVMLNDGDGYTVTSANPLKVACGSNASFEVEVDPEYIIDSLSGGAVYEDGVVTLENVKYPTTVQIASRPRELYTFFVVYDSKSGSLTYNQESKTVYEGTEVVLTATPKEGTMFLGYSSGGYIKNGGTVLSYSTEYAFNIKSNIRLYANYAEQGSKIIIYGANGGEVVNSSMDTVFVQITDSHYICPNTLNDNGTFNRDGYVLCGYNTEADGSGKFYGLGWNIIMPENGMIKLYAQWMKESEASLFQYKVASKRVTITGYTGDEETVVIPKKIEGYPVTSIAAGAFNGKAFKTLYFSKNLSVVADKAIRNCKQFTTLYFSDTIVAITDNFYENCPEFNKLYMCAVRAPTYTSGRNGNYQIKYERLITAPGKKLIITAGSNCAYGIISEQLMAGLSEDYSVVNYGCNASTATAFYIEVAAKHMNAGDIHLHAPELSSYQWGYNEINVTLWQIFEGAYDAFSDVDIRYYIKLFTSFASFNTARTTRKALTYENYSTETVNMYGDYIQQKNGQRYTPSYNTKDFKTTIITGDYNKYLNRTLDLVAAAGGRNYLSFAVVNEVSVKEASKDLDYLTKYMNTAAENVHAMVISNPWTYILDSKYFYNSDYHLNTAGAVVRTGLIIKDINAQLAKEKQ